MTPSLRSIVVSGRPVYLALAADCGQREVSDRVAVVLRHEDGDTATNRDLVEILSKADAMHLVLAPTEFADAKIVCRPSKVLFAGDTVRMKPGDFTLSFDDLLLHQTIETKSFLAWGANAFVKPLEGWRWRDFAARRCPEYPQYWMIQQLPVGTPLAIDWCAFTDFDDAVAAMKEMQRLRNDWHVIRQADMTKALEAQLHAIAKRHNAVGVETHGIVGVAGRVDRDKYNRVMRRRLNGYGEVLDR